MERTRIILAAAMLFVASTAVAQTNPVWPYPGQTAGGAAPLDVPLLSSTQPKWVNQLPIPVDFTPDKTTYPGWDYYEIQMAAATPAAYWAGGPQGTEWLGLVDPTAGFCGATTTACSATTPCAAGVVCTPNVTSPLYRLYTPVWGYGQVNAGGGPLGGAVTYPAMNIRGTKGTPVKVKWINNAPDTHLFCQQPQNSNWPCAIDRTLMGTKAVGPAPWTTVNAFGGGQQPDNAMVIHFHGGEIPPNSDGFAELWFGNTASAAFYSPNNTALPIDPPLSLASGAPLNLVRPIGNSMLYNYPMVNEASTLWYHDHALGKTRINVAAGPAGFFNVIDPGKEPAGLPSGKYEINVVFQDRDFNAPQPNSNLAPINFPNGLNQAQVAPVPFQTPLTPGGNPTVHPQWVPEYFGTFAIVNGMAWPSLNVEPRKYRFHFLDGSNARCWNFKRSDALPMTVIGTEQGYLKAPVVLTKFVMCPGERYDVVIDFTGMAPGTIVQLLNDAPAPFPKGVSPKVGDVKVPIQFVVGTLTGPDTSVIPPALVPVTPLAPTAGLTPREMVLNEVLDATTLYPLRVQIDGKAFEDPITETPKKGNTEQWTFINTTGDAHPIHLHLVKFQIVSRQVFDAAGYSAATGFAVPGNGTFKKLPIGPYLKNKPRLPAAYEAGWKDTAISYPGETLTVVAKWDGAWSTTLQEPAGGYQGELPAVAQPAFLDVTSGPYVWHCHIVDHEDNEMMRPVMVLP